MAPAELQAGGRAGARDDVAQRGVDPRQVVGMYALERGTTHELGRGEAQQALDGVAGEQPGPVGSDERDDVPAVLDQRAKAHLALAHGLFRAALRGHSAPHVDGAQYVETTPPE